MKSNVFLALISVSSLLPLMELFTIYKIEQKTTTLEDEGLKKQSN